MTILERAKKEGIKFIQLQFTDLVGIIKNVTIPIKKFLEAIEKGVWFDGSSIEGFARICESDMFLKPDLSTYAVLPWEKKTARVICDIYKPNGKPFEGDPRYILKRALEKASDLGFRYMVGPELEFFLFKLDNELKPTLHDSAGYFDFSPRDQAVNVRRDVIYALESMSLDVEASHHEVAPGQHEIDFKYADALKTADNAITFKHAVKSIAYKHGLHATFMPKPVFGINGSGMHVHQSLFNFNNENVFYDKEDRYKLSEIAKHFIAGQLAHIKGICAILAPNVNSYKRLVPGYEAPVYICWGQINRSALIRIPRYSPGREQSIRAELRCPDPSCNPYLAFAVMLMSGLDGIKRKLPLPEPVEEDVYEFGDEKLTELGIDTLPGSLGEAIDEMKRDGIVLQTLGEHAYNKYLHAKKLEWDEYRLQVTKWELKRYFEIT